MDERKSIFDPTVKAGDTVDVHGLPVQVVEQEKIDDAVEKGEMLVLCMRVNSMPEYVVPGSVKAICGKCHQDIWISPATLASVGLAPLRCMECLTKEMEDE